MDRTIYRRNSSEGYGNRVIVIANNHAGRVCRAGQQKRTEFRVLWVAGEAHDEAPRLFNKTRMTESEALTQIDAKRLLRKRKRKANEEEMEEEEPGAAFFD